MTTDQTSAIDAVYQIIVDDNPALATKTFIGFTPSSATGLVRELTEDEGTYKETFAPGIQLEMPMVEIGLRGVPEDYTGPRNEAIRLRRLISRVTDYELEDIRILRFVPEGGILHLGRDEQRRTMFTLRFTAVMKVRE